MEELVAVDRNSRGEIISFKTSTGRVISYQKALMEIEQGIITGVRINEDNSESITDINSDDTFQQFFDNFPPIY